MRKIFLLLMVSFSLFTFGQVKSVYEPIDKQVSEIPSNSCNSTEAIASYIGSHFKTEREKIRAVFYWTASNISYDIKNIATIDYSKSSLEKIQSTLETRKGVCIHYAEVFNDITNKLGMKSYIIDGYTKQNGKISPISHAWCAAEIDKKWYVFDPTWGSGYVSNGKFVKKINDYYFKTEPSKIISSHMPFDYLWQFLNYPITNQEFFDGKTQENRSKIYFDYIAEIEKESKFSEEEKIDAEIVRITKNGIKSNLILECLTAKKKESAVYNQNANIGKMNTIVADYNQAVSLFNDFIYYRNKRFKPTLSDDEINNMIQLPKEKLLNCQKLIDTVGSVGGQNLAVLASLRKNIYDVLKQVSEHESFVKEYLSKGKGARKGMFSKVNWFGVPLNNQDDFL